jgi:hypothetical protein
VRNGREMLVVVAPLEWLESLRHDESGETITWLGKQERDNIGTVGISALGAQR